MLRLLPTRPDPERAQEPDRRPADPLKGLVEAGQRGQPEAIRTLLAAVGPHQLRVIRGALGANHPDVEDVLQEAMSAFYQALPGFRGESKTVHFACRIAVQIALNLRRHRRYRDRYTPNCDTETLDQLGTDRGSPAEELERARRCQALRELLQELPTPQAEVLALHILAGQTVEETAGLTSTPVNTVRSRLRTALSSLRDRVQANPGIHEILRRQT